ncbi:MAG: hypothetical protein ACOC2D_06885 [Spirochaetota bacterium]
MDRTTGNGRRSRWDERYSGDEFFFDTESNDFLAEVAPQLPRAVVGLASGGAFVLEACTPDQLAYRTGAGRCGSG